MKVLAINGSARKDGNTAILIHTVFEDLLIGPLAMGRCRGMFRKMRKVLIQ